MTEIALVALAESWSESHRWAKGARDSGAMRDSSQCWERGAAWKAGQSLDSLLMNTQPAAGVMRSERRVLRALMAPNNDPASSLAASCPHFF